MKRFSSIVQPSARDKELVGGLNAVTFKYIEEARYIPIKAQIRQVHIIIVIIIIRIIVHRFSTLFMINDLI